jgi:hypothetical protein
VPSTPRTVLCTRRVVPRHVHDGALPRLHEATGIHRGVDGLGQLVRVDAVQQHELHK